jgi:hypothetical protein
VVVLVLAVGQRETGDRGDVYELARTLPNTHPLEMHVSRSMPLQVSSRQRPTTAEIVTRKPDALLEARH